MNSSARPIIIVVFDGLQPAQLTPELMPHLSDFAAEGAVFRRSYAVFPTVTRANVASIVTGQQPGAHGLTANTLVIREFDPVRALPALEAELTAVARRVPPLLAPTLADRLAAHGREFIAVGAGTSGNAYLQNPNAASVGGATIHPDFCLPRPLHSELAARFGEWPPAGETYGARLAHAVDLFTGYGLAERRPAAALLWFSEPDHAQHGHGVGSAVANRAIAEADAQFGRLRQWLESHSDYRDADVFVLSDHGYSTIIEAVGLEALLREAGFPPGDRAGGVTLAPNGGSALFYVNRDDPAAFQDACERLARWLFAQPWCGAVLASDAAGPLPGTLPAALVGLEGPRAPELTLSFRWDAGVNAAGYRGRAYATNLGPGQGQHGSMSPYETRNVLLARGPGFRECISLDAPAGNADIAPTILHLLQLPGAETMGGRVLYEALAGDNAPARDALAGDAPQAEMETRRAELRLNGGRYRQHITVSRVGRALYVDEGAGGFE